MNNDIFDDLMDEEITKESLREDIDECENSAMLSMYEGLGIMLISVLIPIVGIVAEYYNEISQYDLIITAIGSLGLFNLGLFLLVGAVITGDIVRDNRIIMYRLQMMYEDDSQSEGDAL